MYPWRAFSGLREERYVNRGSVLFLLLILPYLSVSQYLLATCSLSTTFGRSVFGRFEISIVAARHK